jgi:hypothetical protein
MLQLPVDSFAKLSLSADSQFRLGIAQIRRSQILIRPKTRHPDLTKRHVPAVIVRLRNLRDKLIVLALRNFGLSSFTFAEPVNAEFDPSVRTNYKILYPAVTIDFGNDPQDRFIRNSQYITNGHLDRQNISVCELADAKFFPDMGLVFASSWSPVVESILDRPRLTNFKRILRPRRVERRTGVYSSVQHLWPFNIWHWTVDSLPQVCSLATYMEGRPLTLLMARTLGVAQRASLEAILPPNFVVEYVDPNQWFDLETFILPSHVSSRANGYLPAEYYDFIRTRTFAKLDVSKPVESNGRYYISRERAAHRRVLNESAVIELLQSFGFESLFIEDYGFAEQVALFRNAEAIVSPHSAALGGIIYADHLKLCVLYPEERPAGYFYTLACGLGHQHFSVHSDTGEDDNFSVDTDALRQVLIEMHLD